MILNVTKARIDEILQMIKKQIFDPGLNLICGENIYIIGGGSNVSNLEKYFSDFFKLNVKKLPINDDKESKIDENFTSCLGALKIIRDGWETEAIPEPINKSTEKVSFFSRIFGAKF